MSTAEKPRSPRPQVYGQRRAIEQAGRLGVQGCLEVAVADAICKGLKRGRCEGLRPPLASDERVVHLGRGVIARLRRSSSPLLKSPAWTVTAVLPAPTTRRSKAS